MKPSHLILFAVALLAGGTLWLLGVRHPARVQASTALEPGPPVALGAEESRTLELRVEQLGDELAALRAEVRELDVSRRTVVDAPPTVEEPAASTDERSELLEDPLQDAQRTADREQRELEMLVERAQRMARQIGFTDDEEQRFADLLFEHRDRRLALVQSMRTQAPSRTRDARMRDSMLELREWLHRELAARFGAARAQEIRTAFEARGFGRTPIDPGG